MISRKNALTLIEVLIAILVFSIGVIAVITMFPLSLQNVQTSQDILVATELASSTLEYFNQPVRSVQGAIAAGSLMSGFMPIKDINSAGSIIIPNTQSYYELEDDTIIPRYIGYERAIEAELMPSDSDFMDRYLVTVTIRWDDSRGRSQNFSLSGIIFANKRVY